MSASESPEIVRKAFDGCSSAGSWVDAWVRLTALVVLTAGNVISLTGDAESGCFFPLPSLQHLPVLSPHDACVLFREFHPDDHQPAQGGH